MFAEKYTYLQTRSWDDWHAGCKAFIALKPWVESYAEKNVPSAQMLLGVIYELKAAEESKLLEQLRQTVEQARRVNKG